MKRTRTNTSFEIPLEQLGICVDFFCIEDLGRLLKYIYHWQRYGEFPEDIPQILDLAMIPFIMHFEKEDKSKKRGKYHPQWKDGASSKNHLIRNSSKYKYWRTSVFIRDDYMCRKCGELGGELNAHHIESFSKHPALRFDIDNGITLCKKCHIEIHKSEGIK